MSNKKRKKQPQGKRGRQPARDPAASDRKRMHWWFLPIFIALGLGGTLLLIFNPFSTPRASGPNQEGEEPQSALENLAGADLKQETLDVARKLLADFPNESGPLSIMGVACSSLGQQDEAVTWYRRSLELDPTNAELHYMMAGAALLQGDFELALERCRRTLELDPRQPNAHGRMGRTLLELGRPEEAVTALKTELMRYPQTEEVEFRLGQAYVQLRRYEEAVPHLERAYQQKPQDPAPLYSLSTAYARMGQREKAREYAERFRSRQGEGISAMRDRRQEKDVDAFKKAEIAANIYTISAQVYFRKGQEQVAESYLRRAVVLDRRNVLCRRMLSELHVRHRNWNGSLDMCRQLAQLQPGNAQHYVNAGIALANLKRLNEAEKNIRHALKLAPRSSAVRRALLQVLMHANHNLPDAKIVAEQLVQLEPTAPNYVMLGNLRRRMGDRAGALAAMEKAARLAPGDPQINQAYRNLKEGR